MDVGSPKTSVTPPQSSDWVVAPDTVPIEQLHRHLGSHPLDDGRTRFVVWSPTSDEVQVRRESDGSLDPLSRLDSGYHVGTLNRYAPGDQYRMVFDGGPPLPDPASRFQPDGVHGPSEIVDARFEWSDEDWTGVPRDDWVLYELHVGTFTGPGTFAAAIDRLDELVDLGITAIELMPIADAAGRWNWGYDGVNLFAPNRNYGSPDDVRRFVDAAHAKGLAVFLDVVYNHLGPEGNYLGAAGPYLSDRHHTVWGSAPAFDDREHGPQCRRFFIANAIYWLDEFHFDGLRVDAIHCMKDESDEHVAIEMSRAVGQWKTVRHRPGILIAESNVYDADMLRPIENGGVGFDAQWSDDFVHSVFSVLRPGEQLCHRTYQPGADLDQTLRMGYVYAGTLAGDRGRQTVADPVASSGLIRCIQNHDFIGNHPLGQRLGRLTSPDTQRAAATLMMLLPSIPMLFMGEEFACPRPFQFFVDFGDEHLRQSVIDGRKREYPQHDWSRGTLPTDAAAFDQSKIGPVDDRSLWEFYRELISIRRRWRSRGLIRDQVMTVENDPLRGLYSIRYETESMRAGVWVRLIASSSSQPPITVDPRRWIIDTLADHSATKNNSPPPSCWAKVWES